MKRSLLIGLAALLAASLVGCGGGGGGGGGATGPATSGSGAKNPTNPAVTQVGVQPANPTLEVGKTIVVTALGMDVAGNPVPVNGANWLWTTSDQSVVSITSRGDHVNLTAKKVGAATLTAKEGASGTASTINVTVVAAGTSNPNPAGSVVVYSNDFSNGAAAVANGAGPEWSDRKISALPVKTVFPSANFLGDFGNETVSLSLSGLPAHGNLIVEFDLFILRSMDGNYSLMGLGPDIWDLSVEGGPSLLHTTFSNINPSLAQAGFPEGFFQAYPGTFPNSSFPYQTGAIRVNSLGYAFSGQNDDALYHIKKTVPDTSSALKLDFSSAQTQDITDESWGIKNVVVSVAP
jgi:hypothetical protein